MRKLILLVISLLVATTSFGQTYRPMLSDNSEWYYFESGFVYGTTRYYVDTIITFGGNEYKFILSEYGDYGGGPYLLREDSASKKVYINTSRGDRVLYDYNLLPGDTFSPHNSSQKYILDSITTNHNQLISTQLEPSCFVDSTRNDINPPKILYFSTENYTGVNFIWIEGIGSLAGLINDMDNSFSCYKLLSCHYNELGNKDFYLSIFNGENHQDGECYTDYSTSINDIKKNEPLFNLSPNPSNGSFTIETQELINIKIYNIQGKLVYKINSNLSYTAINIENQPKGIYVVQVEFKNGKIKTKKLVLN